MLSYCIVWAALLDTLEIRGCREHIYEQVELSGSSATIIENAVQGVMTKAAATLHHFDWSQIIETRGILRNILASQA